MCASAGTVIIGDGHGGVELADALRREGYLDPITLVGEHRRTPYQRPPLSKDYMTAGQAPGPLLLRGERFFDEKAIDLRVGAPAVSIDRSAGTVALADGTRLAYDKLVLATGAAGRAISVPGNSARGIHQLRTLDDARTIHDRLSSSRSVVVIGAGFIGMEFAAAARSRGLSVLVLESADRPMARAVSPVTSAYFADALVRSGAELVLGEGLERFETVDGVATGVIGSRGNSYAADLILVGIGVAPRTELATGAGLEVDNGVVVDRSLRSSDENIFAIGDCASSPSSTFGHRARIESVQNATEQARHVARSITSKSIATEPYAAVPWFWSQQGHSKLQIAGIIRPGDEFVHRGDPNSDRFSVFCFRAGRLRAVESVNLAADHMTARRLLATATNLTREQASDPTFDLKTYSKNLAAA